MVSVPTTEVIEIVEGGTQVTYKYDLGDGYAMIKLADGEEGAIKEENLEVKKVMDEKN